MKFGVHVISYWQFHAIYVKFQHKCGTVVLGFFGLSVCVCVRVILVEDVESKVELHICSGLLPECDRILHLDHKICAITGQNPYAIT